MTLLVAVLLYSGYTFGQAPTVTSTQPADNAQDIAPHVNIRINYSTEIRRVNDTGLNDNNVDALITLKEDNASGLDVAFNASINGELTTVTIDPTAVLKENQWYFVRMERVESATNDTIATAPTFRFRTGAYPTINSGGLSFCATEANAGLGNITINEQLPNNFITRSAVGENQSFVIQLPMGYQFVEGQGSAQLNTPGNAADNDIVLQPLEIRPNDNPRLARVRFANQNGGNNLTGNHIDIITISGLQVALTVPGVNPGGNIVFTDASDAFLPGVNLDGFVLGTITADAAETITITDATACAVDPCDLDPCDPSCANRCSGPTPCPNCDPCDIDRCDAGCSTRCNGPNPCPGCADPCDTNPCGPGCPPDPSCFDPCDLDPCDIGCPPNPLCNDPCLPGDPCEPFSTATTQRVFTNPTPRTVSVCSDGQVCVDFLTTIDLNDLRVGIVRNGTPTMLTNTDYSITFAGNGLDKTLEVRPLNGNLWQFGDQLYITDEPNIGASGCFAFSDTPIEIQAWDNNPDVKIQFIDAQTLQPTAAIPITETELAFSIGNNSPPGEFRILQNDDTTLVTGSDVFRIVGFGVGRRVGEEGYLDAGLPPQDQLLRNPEPYVFNPGLFPINRQVGTYVVRLQWGDGTGNYTCGFKEIVINVFDNTPRQLVGIQNASVCRSEESPIPIGWIGQGQVGILENIEIINCDGSNCNSIISGILDEDYDSSVGVLSGFNIEPNGIADDVTSFEVRIDYEVCVGGNCEIRSLTETITVEEDPEPLITLFGNEGTLREEYCADADDLEFLGALNNGNIVGGERIFEVRDLDNDNVLQFDQNNRIVFQEDSSAIAAPTEITLGPNNNGYAIDFTFISAAGCDSTVTDTIFVRSLPAAISSQTIFFNFCVGDVIPPLRIIDQVPGLDPTDQLVWSTQSGIPIATVAYDEGFVASDISTQFASTTLFRVQRLSALGCLGVPTLVEVNVGNPPTTDFTFVEACALGTVRFRDASNTGIVNPTPKDQLAEWIWNFGNDPINPRIDTVFTDDPQTYVYDTPGIYEVSLTVRTAIGCAATITKQVVVHDVAVFDEQIYRETFEDNQGTWTSSSQSDNANGEAQFSSWEWVTLESGEGAWRTRNDIDTYNNSEKSWIESPCILLDAIDQPYITLKLRYDTDIGDGAVLQVGTYVLDMDTGDSTILWQRLGNIDQGLDWYNSTDIAGIPLTLDEARMGWTGKTDDWVFARYDLADVQVANMGRYVRFRIFFGSNADDTDTTPEGFVLDEVEIRNKERVVLIEHFSNLRDVSFQDGVLEQYLNTNRSLGYFADIRYHTVYPIRDAVASINFADNSARSLHYKLINPPQVVIDGAMMNLEGEGFSLWEDGADDYYNKRTLFSTPFNINIAPPVSGNGQVEIEATVTRNNSLGLIDDPVLVQMAVVEKDAEVEGRILHNIVHRMLPTAAGTRFDRVWEVGDTEVVRNTWEVGTSGLAGEFKVIVFVADEETKEIYQATEIDLPDFSQARMAELADDFEEDLNLYPNPADQVIYLQLQQPFTQPATWEVYNAIGKKVLDGTWQPEAAKMEVKVGGLPNGVYIFNLNGTRKKFNILN